MEQPLVSVIVPIYNAKDHIARCVESIRRQTYQNLEILLLNDGSQDVSYQVCEMFARVDPRILLIDKANSGVAATRNLGLRCARGDYLQFVDADDTIEPDATRLFVEKAEAYRTDLVIAYYNRVTPPHPVLEKERTQKAVQSAKEILSEEAAQKLSALQKTRIKPYGFLPEGFLDKNEFARGLMGEPASFYYGVMWNKFYRADLVRQHPDVICNEDLNWSEDLYFNLSFIRYADRFYSLTVPIYNYLNNPASLCHTVMNPLNVMSTRMELFLYYKDLYESLGLYEENKAQIFKYLLATAEA